MTDKTKTPSPDSGSRLCVAGCAEDDTALNALVPLSTPASPGSAFVAVDWGITLSTDDGALVFAVPDAFSYGPTDPVDGAPYLEQWSVEPWKASLSQLGADVPVAAVQLFGHLPSGGVVDYTPVGCSGGAALVLGDGTTLKLTWLGSSLGNCDSVSVRVLAESS